MSHIPASAMPHAAPKHPDADAPLNGAAMASEPAATSADAPPVAAAESPEAKPVAVPPTAAALAENGAPAASVPAAKPKRGGLSTAAFAAGGIALAAGAIAFAIPTFRRIEAKTPTGEKARKGRKGKP